MTDEVRVPEPWESLPPLHPDPSEDLRMCELLVRHTPHAWELKGWMVLCPGRWADAG